MNYNKPDTKLDECIFIAEKIIPVDFCDAVVQEIEARPWQPHTWYSNAQDSYYSEETKELDVQNSTPKLQRVLAHHHGRKSDGGKHELIYIAIGI